MPKNLDTLKKEKNPLKEEGKQAYRLNLYRVVVAQILSVMAYYRIVKVLKIMSELFQIGETH